MTRYPALDLASFIALCSSRSEARTVSKFAGREFNKAEKEGLSVEQADRIAGRLKRHPAEVWPDWSDLSAAEVSRACDHCTTSFTPWRKDQRFCSRRCNQRWWANEQKARRYAADPVYRERLLERRRAYYRECGDYERARQRRYDQAKKERAA